MRDIVWDLAYKHLKRNDWKKLAELWEFTDAQMAAIEEQWTGQREREMLLDQIFRIILFFYTRKSLKIKPKKGISAAPILSVNKGIVHPKIKSESIFL